MENKLIRIKSESSLNSQHDLFPSLLDVLSSRFDKQFKGYFALLEKVDKQFIQLQSDQETKIRLLGHIRKRFRIFDLITKEVCAELKKNKLQTVGSLFKQILFGQHHELNYVINFCFNLIKSTATPSNPEEQAKANNQNEQTNEYYEKYMEYEKAKDQTMSFHNLQYRCQLLEQQVYEFAADSKLKDAQIKFQKAEMEKLNESLAFEKSITQLLFENQAKEIKEVDHLLVQVSRQRLRILRQNLRGMEAKQDLNNSSHKKGILKKKLNIKAKDTETINSYTNANAEIASSSLQRSNSFRLKFNQESMQPLSEDRHQQPSIQQYQEQTNTNKHPFDANQQLQLQQHVTPTIDDAFKFDNIVKCPLREVPFDYITRVMKEQYNLNYVGPERFEILMISYNEPQIQPQQQQQIQLQQQQSESIENINIITEITQDKQLLKKQKSQEQEEDKQSSQMSQQQQANDDEEQNKQYSQSQSNVAPLQRLMIARKSQYLLNVNIAELDQLLREEQSTLQILHDLNLPLKTQTQMINEVQDHQHNYLEDEKKKVEVPPKEFADAGTDPAYQIIDQTQAKKMETKIAKQIKKLNHSTTEIMYLNREIDFQKNQFAEKLNANMVVMLESKQTCKGLEQKIKDQEQIIQDKDASYEKKNEDIEVLNHEVKMIQKEALAYRQFKIEFQDKLTEIEVLKKQICCLNEEITSFSEMQKNTADDQRLYEQTIQQKMNDIQSLESQIIEIQKQHQVILANFQLTCADYQQKIVSLENMGQNHEKREATYLQKISDLNELFENTKVQMSNISQDLVDALQTIYKRDQEEPQNAKLQKDQQMLIEDMKAQIKSVTEANKKQANEQNEQNEVIKTLQAEIIALQAMIQECKGTMSDKESEIKLLHQEIELLESQQQKQNQFQNLKSETSFKLDSQNINAGTPSLRQKTCSENFMSDQLNHLTSQHTQNSHKSQTTSENQKENIDERHSVQTQQLQEMSSSHTSAMLRLSQQALLAKSTHTSSFKKAETIKNAPSSSQNIMHTQPNSQNDFYNNDNDGLIQSQHLSQQQFQYEINQSSLNPNNNMQEEDDMNNNFATTHMSDKVTQCNLNDEFREIILQQERDQQSESSKQNVTIDTTYTLPNVNPNNNASYLSKALSSRNDSHNLLQLIDIPFNDTPEQPYNNYNIFNKKSSLFSEQMPNLEDEEKHRQIKIENDEQKQKKNKNVKHKRTQTIKWSAKYHLMEFLELNDMNLDEFFDQAYQQILDLKINFNMYNKNQLRVLKLQEESVLKSSRKAQHQSLQQQNVLKQNMKLILPFTLQNYQCQNSQQFITPQHHKMQSLTDRTSTLESSQNGTINDNILHLRKYNNSIQSASKRTYSQYINTPRPHETSKLNEQLDQELMLQKMYLTFQKQQQQQSERNFHNLSKIDDDDLIHSQQLFRKIQPTMDNKLRHQQKDIDRDSEIASFAQFKSFMHNLEETHRKCGKDCIHLKRVYDRLGYANHLIHHRRKRPVLALHKKTISKPPILKQNSQQHVSSFTQLKGW